MNMGDCYEAAGRYMMEQCMSEDCKLILVHAEATGQGPIKGVRYGHAFVLDGNTVIDKSNGRDLQMLKRLYYEIGEISDNVHEYSFEEFRSKVLQHGHWGPWDLNTESGY